jgi:hemoglobin
LQMNDVRRDTIDEELVRNVVHLFYGKVRADPLLGPIFEGRIGPDWDAHLQRLTLFWSALAFKNGAYSGSPHRAHQGLALTAEHFQRWLHLFEETLEQTCRGEAMDFFRDRAHRIADSLQIGLGIGPKALRLP